MIAWILLSSQKDWSMLGEAHSNRGARNWDNATFYVICDFSKEKGGRFRGISLMVKTECHKKFLKKVVRIY
jgi:hypothetical protein